MQKDNTFLGKEPVGRLLWKLAIPTIAAQLINMLYNIVDRVYIGRINGYALTGVGVCLPIIMIVSAFAALASSGGAPRASICMGRGDNETAEQIMGSCFTLQLIISAILTAFLLAFSRDLLLAFGASADTVDYADSYLRIYAIGTLFVQLTLGMNAYITAQGFSRQGMITVLVGAAVNIALDPVFIFALDMGVAGAALATVISQGVSCALVVIFLTGRKTHLRLRLSNMRLRPRLILPSVALGLAPFIMQSSESIISVCFNTSLLKYGGDIAVGAMTILTSVMQFAMLPLQGLAQGAQPITGYNYGSKDACRVRKTFSLLLKCSLIYSTALWAFIMLAPSLFAGMFTSEPELLEFTNGALRIYCAVLLIFGIQIACQMTFVSLGKATSSIIVAVVRKFALLLPLIYLLPAFAEGNYEKTMLIYTAEPVADIIAVSFTAVLFFFQFRHALRKIESSDLSCSRKSHGNNAGG